MKRIVIPTLIFGHILFSKSTAPETSLNLKGKLESHINLAIVPHRHIKTNQDNLISFVSHTQYVSLTKFEKINAMLSHPTQRVSASKRLLAEAKKHLGKRYVWAADGPSKFDCSGFTKYVCDKNGISLPRTSIMQAKLGEKISKDDLKAGDLIFFDTSKPQKGYVNHVGIYLGDHKFIHASSAEKKVMISSLNKEFYNDRFKWGQRVN